MRSFAIATSSRASHRSSKRLSDRTVLMVIVGVTVFILGLVVMLNLASSRALAPVEAAAAVEPSALLPLAAPVNPVVGGHDMNNMPDSSQIHPHTVPAGEPQPNVDLPLLQWDWGTIPAIPAVAQTFPIQNAGDEPLIITSVVSSCGCTTASLSSSVIPPGQRADLKVVFDPNFHETVGPVTRLIWLQTNDPDQPLIEIRLDANVTP
ncbi:MAG: DUF1573 domain-containing protein [Caldilineaceae bacterium]|nr:DUF1573 domain-containing protein [Caldilineaceae bacterium]